MTFVTWPGKMKYWRNKVQWCVYSVFVHLPSICLFTSHTHKPGMCYFSNGELDSLAVGF